MKKATVEIKLVFPLIISSCFGMINKSLEYDMHNITDILLLPVYYLVKYVSLLFGWWSKIYWGSVEPTFWNYVVANAFSFGGAMCIFMVMKAIMNYHRKRKGRGADLSIFEAVAYIVSFTFWFIFTPGMGVIFMFAVLFVILYAIFAPRAKM